MFDWLFEGRSSIYWLLGILGVIFLIVWWRTRKPGYLLALGSVAALGGLYFLLGTVRETPRKQIERKLNEMAAAVKTKDTDAIFKHIAADFHFRGMNRDALRRLVEGQGRGVGELEIFDIEWLPGAEANSIPVKFQAKLKGGTIGDNVPPFPVQAKFVRESDGEWRMQSFEVYNPVQQNQTQDFPITP